MEELVRILDSAGVRYLMIGGQAMRLIGMPRYTMDLDLFIPKGDPGNFSLLNEALQDVLDMPVLPMEQDGRNFIQTYQTRFGVLQFHQAPPGVPPFDVAEREALALPCPDAGGLLVKCLSPKHLLSGKLSASRGKDEDDILFLRSISEG